MIARKLRLLTGALSSLALAACGSSDDAAPDANTGGAPDASAADAAADPVDAAPIDAPDVDAIPDALVTPPCEQVDPPDCNGIDENGDSIDGLLECSVFVDATGGDDGKSGLSTGEAVSTLARGIEIAAGFTPPRAVLDPRSCDERDDDPGRASARADRRSA